MEFFAIVGIVFTVFFAFVFVLLATVYQNTKTSLQFSFLGFGFAILKDDETFNRNINRIFGTIDRKFFWIVPKFMLPMTRKMGMKTFY